jgi:hypothetical protein
MWTPPAFQLSDTIRFNDPKWLAFVIGNGFLNGYETEYEQYEFHGRVIRDRDLTEKAVDRYLANGILPGSARFKVMQAMSAAELADLRERVKS